MPSEWGGKTVAFAGSGGLDSCTITRWLTDIGVNVVCFTADLGQPDEEDIEAVRQFSFKVAANKSKSLKRQTLIIYQ